MEAQSWQNRETLTWPLVLSAGIAKLTVTFTNHFYDETAREGGQMNLDRLDVIDAGGRRGYQRRVRGPGPTGRGLGPLREGAAQRRDRSRGFSSSVGRSPRLCGSNRCRGSGTGHLYR